MGLQTDPHASSEPPNVSMVSKLVGYVILSIFFFGGGALVIPSSHSALFGASWIFGGVVCLAALWATNQTRLTVDGVSGFSMSGLRLPRRVALTWHQIVRVEQSEYQLKVHGQDSTVQIGLAMYSNPKEVVTFMRSKLTQLAP